MFSVDPPSEMTLEVRGFIPCSKCGDGQVAILLTPNLPHYAKALCVGCGRFREWVPHPDRAERTRCQVADIDKVLPMAESDAWSLGFLCSIRTRLVESQSLSPNQTSKLDEVLTRYLDPQEREWNPDPSPETRAHLSDPLSLEAGDRRSLP